MQERVQTGHVFPVGTAMPPRFLRLFVSRSLTPTLINELISVIPREKCLIAPLWFEDVQLWGVDGRCYCGCPRRWEALPQCEGRRHESFYSSAGRTIPGVMVQRCTAAQSNDARRSRVRPVEIRGISMINF